MQETSVVKCKDCQEEKTRFLKGMFNGKDKKWVDDKNCLWNGHRCPDCHRTKTKNRMKAIRDTRIATEC